MPRASLLQIVRQPAIWILGAFLFLVVLEMVFWAGDRQPFPSVISGSILYPVGLALLAYVLVFRGTDHYANFKVFLAAFSGAAGVATLFLLSKRPLLFDTMAAEDGFIENLSAAALFVGAAVFLMVAIGRMKRRNVLPAGIAAAFAVVLFVIGMEEISWMQRVFNFETSDYFIERNIQNEMNLHNFDTGLTEKVFYFGGFLTLIVMPFFHGPLVDFLRQRKMPEVAALLPEPWVLVPSSMMVGYVGTSVTGDPTAGIAAMVTAFILFRLAVSNVWAGNLPKFMVYAAFLVLVCVMAYYFTTYDYASVGIRRWARKEYLELIIALGLMGWAVSALHQSVTLDESRGRGEPLSE